jgi:sugar lactone lactonase YvrE
MRGFSAAILSLVFSCCVLGQTPTINTFAGGGLPVNIAGTSAGLRAPKSVAVDGAGNLFFTDLDDVVLRLDAVTGTVTLEAGNGTPGYTGDNGPATSAQLRLPAGVATDAAGNLYIADTGNNCVRMISNGTITTVVGGLNQPAGVAVDASGNLYIADTYDHRILKVATGVITKVAGGAMAGFGGDNGPATSALLDYPSSVAVDGAGNLYIADSGNGRIRKVSNGTITTVAGNGIADHGCASVSELGPPGGIAVDTAGNLYIADGSNNCVRKLSGSMLTAVAGNGTAGFSGDTGLATSAELQGPTGVAVDLAGNVYVADQANRRIRKVSAGVITTVAGNGSLVGENGPATSAQLYMPSATAVDSAGNLYIADTDNQVIRRVSNGVVTTVAGNGTYGYSGDGGPATSAQLYNPMGVAVDAAGDLYIASNGVRKVSNGVISTVAWIPACAIAVDAAGDVYSADCFGNLIRKVSNGVVTTVAGGNGSGFSGDNGPATSAQLYNPIGVAVDAAGNLFIADMNNNRIREVSNGVITTVAGGGSSLGDNGPATSAQMWGPTGVAIDTAGNLYIADWGNSRIRKVSNGVITTVAGTGVAGFSGDTGPASSAELDYPYGLAVDSAGDVYVADSDNDRVRVIVPASPALSIAITDNGIFAQGQIGATYTVTVSNQVGAALSSGTVTVTESVPVGLTLTSMVGTGWTCPSGGTTCTRSDMLAAGASYPSITVTVNVTANATSPQVNTVRVSGGGSPDSSVSDPTIIAMPSVISVSPSAGSGWSQTFTFTLSDTAGAGAISEVYVTVNGTFSSASGCFFEYYRPANTFWLSNDADTAWQGSTAVGSGAPVSNSQCTLSGAGASGSIAGNQLTVSVPVTFKTAFAGVKKVYVYVDDNANLNSGWQTAGAWTIPAGSEPPSVVSVSPSTGNGLSQTFTFTLSDPAGAAAINDVYVLVNGAFSSASGCFFEYYQPANTFWLSNDADTAWQVPAPRYRTANAR